ncbi:MAG TPA: [Fe-Fe] hydrogenase large subunit C-terminal domain-containing protein [Bacillota bacterium]|nr:[Fe-Fe] hydrogenase large subunit C-terminal domain-containing protein [Bacillota bacterium]
MEPRYHSVILDEDKCKGCTNCIKRCPTEAIRVRNGRAFILTERCIDCGECIRICENHAKRAIGDDLDQAISFPYRVALPAPSLYAQFRRELTPKDLNKALIRLGFHEVAEVAAAAELTTVAIREYLKDLDRLPKPMISSACPVVVRLIQMKYPALIPHLIPVEAPYITAARLAREKVCRERSLRPEEVGLFFLAPCPAKITEVKTDTGQVPLINGVIPISSVYGRLQQAMAHIDEDCSDGGSTTTGVGVGWARTGGENIALAQENVLAVDGIHNVLELLEEIELEHLTDVDYIEALACPNGCVGGALTVENRFVARVKIRKLAEKLDDSRIPDAVVEEGKRLYAAGKLTQKEELRPKAVLQLDNNLADAIRKMGELEEILAELPGMDCGSCGAPTCRSLAEDIVLGRAQRADCVFILREQINTLAQELLLLAKKRPQALKED